MTSLTALDLFAGCGGFTQGLQDAGIHVVAGIDFAPPAIATYRANHDHPAHHAIIRDLTAYSPQQFQADYAPPTLDIIVGGPPCQGFSVAGRRNKSDPRNNLFLEFVAYLNHFRPRAFLMENVVGILSMKTPDGQTVLPIILGHLGQHYNVHYYKLLASDYQVPQNRRRVIFVGFRKDTGLVPSKPPAPDASPIPVKDVLLSPAKIPASAFLSPRAIAGIKRKKTEMQAKGYGFGAQFLDPDKPSYTIPARYWKDGYDALVRYTDTRIRRLVIPELQAIQSFPASYKFHGSKKEQIIQIGNAIPCRLAYYLGLYLREQLTPPT